MGRNTTSQAPPDNNPRAQRLADRMRGGMNQRRAIVGMVDVTLGRQLEDVLEAHIAAAGGLLRGFRITPTVDPQTRYYARPRLGQSQSLRLRCKMRINRVRRRLP